jgi:hypothetical protein
MRHADLRLMPLCCSYCIASCRSFSSEWSAAREEKDLQASRGSKIKSSRLSRLERVARVNSSASTPAGRCSSLHTRRYTDYDAS